MVEFGGGSGELCVVSGWMVISFTSADGVGCLCLRRGNDALWRGDVTLLVRVVVVDGATAGASGSVCRIVWVSQST